MAGGDVQVAIPNGSAPTSKQILGQTAILPKAVSATFDGSGAGVAFSPCLIITGREGYEVARIPAPEVAAGAAAEVSWFPRVAAPAAKGAGFSWCAAWSALNTSIAPGASSADLVIAETNDPAAFSQTAGFPTRVEFDKPGTYLCLFSFDSVSHPGAPIANPWTKVLQGGPGVHPGSILFGPESFSDASGTASQHWDKTWLMMFTVSSLQTGGTLNWNWNNLTGATLESAFGGVTIIRLAD